MTNTPSINKKVLNAQPNVYNGIHFKSKLETRIYIDLVKKGLKPKYEVKRIKIWDRDSFSVPYFDKVKIKGKKTFQQVVSKPICVHYTPDFIIKYKGITVFLEAKGRKNDVAPYKIRMFRDWLEDFSKTNKKVCYAVVYSLKDLNKLFNYLDNLIINRTFA